MRGGWRAHLIVLLVAGAATGLLACSGDDDDVQQDRSIAIGFYTQPDFLDPALGFTLVSAAALNQVYLPLLTYRRAEDISGTRLIPGLAKRLPEISPDRRTYTLRLRRHCRQRWCCLFYPLELLLLLRLLSPLLLLLLYRHLSSDNHCLLILNEVIELIVVISLAQLNARINSSFVNRCRALILGPSNRHTGKSNDVRLGYKSGRASNFTGS